MEALLWPSSLQTWQKDLAINLLLLKITIVCCSNSVYSGNCSDVVATAVE